MENGLQTTGGSNEPLGIVETSKAVAAALAVLVTSTITSVAAAATYANNNISWFNTLVESIRKEGFITGISDCSEKLNAFLIDTFTVEKEAIEANRASIEVSETQSQILEDAFGDEPENSGADTQ